MLCDVKGVGDKYLDKFHKLGIYTEEDLLNCLPRQYLDMNCSCPIDQASDGLFCTVDLIITEKKTPVRRPKMQIFYAYGKSDDYKVKLVWYNQPYVAKNLEVGSEYTFFGKIKINDNCYEFNNPRYEKKCEITKFQGVQPIYFTKGLIPQKTYWGIVKNALKNYRIESIVPQKLLKLYNVGDLNEAYKNIHCPLNTDVKCYSSRIAIERLIRRMAAFRLESASRPNIRFRDYSVKCDFGTVLKNLSYSLNTSQMKAVDNMVDSLKKRQGINSILCGDVGSGKTVVALLICYFVMVNGFQTAFMAPTELLARQDYDNALKLFSDSGLNVRFLSSSTPASERKTILREIAEGDADMLIGTHSLLNGQVKFFNLAFAVTDEQHRFGVAQRTQLISKGQGVDVLTLSATPIPRSMQLVAYGDINYLTIERRYADNIKTAIVRPDKRVSMFRYIAEECSRGKQCYVVAPKIFDEEGVEKENVEQLYEELEGYFPEGALGLLHGKMKAAEKQEIIEEFRNKRLQALVATTVVEVGLDVPNASIIIIMDADNFGLATLHQLRGRVGRDGSDAYCFLYSEKCGSVNLSVMTEISDGFKIAEEDFRNRGGGDILGLTQSGGGTLDGITFQNLEIAKKIVDGMPLESLRGELQAEIDSFSLDKVSLT